MDFLNTKQDIKVFQNCCPAQSLNWDIQSGFLDAYNTNSEFSLLVQG